MNGDIREVLEALFITARNVYLCGGTVALLFLLGVGLNKHWRTIYKANITSYLALIICEAAVWIPGLRPGLPEGQEEVAGIDGSEIGFRIVLGLLLALIAYLVHRTMPMFVLWLGKKFLPENIAKGLEKAILRVW